METVFILMAASANVSFYYPLTWNDRENICFYSYWNILKILVDFMKSVLKTRSKINALIAYRSRFFASTHGENY